MISNEDEDFKSKVEFLLSQEGVVSNPVQYLIDGKRMKEMSSEAQERYLLSTLDKYFVLKNKLENKYFIFWHLKNIGYGLCDVKERK